MKTKIYFIFLSTFVYILSACFGGSKEKLPTVTCTIICDSTHLLPKSNNEFAIAYFDVTINNVNKYPSTGHTTDSYEYILIIPKDTRAVVNDKTYFLSVKKKFEKIMGKKVHKLPSTHIGRPDNIKKGDFFNITAKDTSLISGILDLIHNNDIFYNVQLEQAIKIMRFPDIDANLRSYNVRQIYITEYYIQNGQTITVNGQISGDTLFLLY